jgi:hypothetical protein
MADRMSPERAAGCVGMRTPRPQPLEAAGLNGGKRNVAVPPAASAERRLRADHEGRKAAVCGHARSDHGRGAMSSRRANIGPLCCEGSSAPLPPHAPPLSAGSRESDNLKRKATPTPLLPTEHPAADRDREFPSVSAERIPWSS